MTRGLAILGATGSIGTTAQALLQGPLGKMFTVVGLAAWGSRPEALAQAGRAVGAARLVTAGHEAGRALREVAGGLLVRTGRDAVLELATDPDVELVLVGIPGTAALEPVHAALLAGKTVALANKESLVAAGEILLRAASEGGGRILPVDSEHNAAFRLLEGVDPDRIHSLLLTASGGPFLHRDPQTLSKVTPEEAMDHPSWRMGPLVSVNSATLMNKGLEVIEAMCLFNLPSSAVDAVIHPPSQVHAIVRWRDGTATLQASPPDMSYALRHALCWPEAPLDGPTFDPTDIPDLSFSPVDHTRFPCFSLARQAAEAGGGAPAVLNAANEVAVSSFLSGNLSFTKIPSIVEKTLGAVEGSPTSLSEVLALDNEARRIAGGLLA